MRETVCLLGSPAHEGLPMDTLAAEYGSSFKHARNLDQLCEVGIENNIVAVLIDSDSLGISTKRALESVLDVLPKVLPIVCHKASETIHWSELVDAGAFHALLLPLCASEVRQSLGFVWEAQQRRRTRVLVLPSRPVASSRRTQAAGILA